MKASPGDSGCGKKAVKEIPTNSAMSAIGILLKFRFTRFDAALYIEPRALPNRVVVADSDGSCSSASVPPELSLLKTRTFVVAQRLFGFLPSIRPNGTNSCCRLLRNLFLIDGMFVLSKTKFIPIASGFPFLLLFLPSSISPSNVVVVVVVVVVVALLLLLVDFLSSIFFVVTAARQRR